MYSQMKEDEINTSRITLNMGSMFSEQLPQEEIAKLIL